MIKLNAIFVGGKYNKLEVTHDELLKLGNGSFKEDKSIIRKQGVLCHRKELDNQPLIDGYLGPMWDGGRLRYETQEAYNILSR